MVITHKTGALFVNKINKQYRDMKKYFTILLYFVPVLLGTVDLNAQTMKKEVTIKEKPVQTETAIFAGGCFWGVEHLMQKQKGVISVESGYIGGSVKSPTYKEICTGKTGHAEAVKIVFDPRIVSYETLAKLFFEIHDPTQANGQGPDIGPQYRSEVFYTNDNQKKTAEALIEKLKVKGYKVVTKVTKATAFWPAEDYHQDYYQRKGTQPYCHKYTPKF